MRAYQSQPPPVVAMTAALEGNREAAPAEGRDGLVAWAARSGRPESRGPVRGGLRFVFYGRVSTEDWQDPVTSRARRMRDSTTTTEAAQR
jgi:hypothetical protein